MPISNCLEVNIHQTYKYIEEYAYIYAFIHKYPWENEYTCMYAYIGEYTII
jgi:hypothetical protein